MFKIIKIIKRTHRRACVHKLGEPVKISFPFNLSISSRPSGLIFRVHFSIFLLTLLIDFRRGFRLSFVSINITKSSNSTCLETVPHSLFYFFSYSLDKSFNPLVGFSLSVFCYLLRILAPVVALSNKMLLFITRLNWNRNPSTQSDDVNKGL